MIEKLKGMGSMLKQAWINRYSIVEGIKNRLLKPNDSLAKDRLRVCNSCPHNSKNTDARPKGNLPYVHCTECGCSLNVKPWCKDCSCPIDKW